MRGQRTDQEVLAHLRLSLTDNVGPITFRNLIQRFGSATRALEALPDLARRGGKRDFRICPTAIAEKEIEKARAYQSRILLLGSVDYPARLARIDDAPPVLYFKGESSLFKPPAVALVGARNASAPGMRMAQVLAAELGKAGFVIVSGLARGIDTAAHKAALTTGTVAAIAGGLDDFYPRENEALQRELFEAGVVVTEAVFGTQPLARHFPRRNRIIAGLSLGTIVVEAARKSGSLITARLAADYGREVFAVPGSPLDPRAHGANDLIRDGAILVQTVEDVLDELARLTRNPASEPQASLFDWAPADPLPVEDPGDAARARVEALLSPAPAEIDDLIRLSELTPAAVLTILLELELAGVARRHPGNRVALNPLPD